MKAGTVISQGANGLGWGSTITPSMAAAEEDSEDSCTASVFMDPSMVLAGTVAAALIAASVKREDACSMPAI